jgi:hypothetical protein
VTETEAAHAHLLVGADPRPFRHLAARGRRLGLEVSLHPEPFPLGSGGALAAAIGDRGRHALVVNAES